MTRIRLRLLPVAATALALLTAACASDRPMPVPPVLPGAAPNKTVSKKDTYDKATILQASKNFFGGATEGLAKVVEKVFADFGEPNAYIAGEEGSGALIVGARYGGGFLHRRYQDPQRVYWRGPTVGFDGGGNASKVFVLIYNLELSTDIYRLYPGVEGSYYFVAGVGVNYQKQGQVVLAPIRTGVGLRAGVNIGYLRYTRKRRWLPF